MTKKLWGGRFEDSPHALMETLGESVSFDARLAPWDIRASIAHARMLGVCGIIDKEDAGRIIEGLEQIAQDVSSGKIVWDKTLEDVHGNIEALLVAKIGDAGKKLHTARSRNDQIATDMRLYTRDQTDTICGLLRDLQHALLAAAERHMEVIMPGYTHLQPAQPVLLAHHLFAYFEMLDRDFERFSQLRHRINVMPLGSAALAGTPHPISREQVAHDLGFEALSANSMDAVSDRDYLIEFCSAASLVMMHLSRWSEELVLWSSPAFGFVEIGDAFTTGSSIMPQKKNPDAAELTRGKTGRVYADLLALLTLMKGLPLTYNRDLQEDKEPVFHASDTVQLCLAVFAAMLPETVFNREAMLQATARGFMNATDLADYLVGKAVPFRKAHEVVGEMVRYCIKGNTSLDALSLQELKQFHPAVEEDVFHALDLQTLLERRNQCGATAPKQVREALLAARKRIQKA
ncbi:MAG TPA: argininosuccinate lyase [Candidatus Hydrogenedentes bacterium]|jgi:argininosuccinate lyase|nr:MAG: Argininosuccinate lyase 1 [Candidatus Hydrogenedentes bacterium ADurb.Bin101]HOC70298.1 argininosuccinate lyase [Candidatus Hydrogenedentota bacterium]HQM99583.1 argininosuccinate lyase [Candidatus Hydrogenedentota bacterium]